MKSLNNLSLEQIDRLIAKKQAQQNVAQQAQLPRASKKESFGRSALESATLGFAPKIAGALGALGARTLRPELFENQSFGETYQQARNLEREKLQQAQQANPLTSLAGGLTGALALPFPAKTIKGASALGGLYGAGYGLGKSDYGQPGSINTEDIISALSGGATGAALGGATQGLVNQFFPVKNAIKPEVQKNIELSQKYNVPLTKGQLTQNPQELLKEETFKLGKRGTASQEAIDKFEEVQRTQFDKALEKINTRGMV